MENEVAVLLHRLHGHDAVSDLPMAFVQVAVYLSADNSANRPSMTSRSAPVFA